MASLATTEKKTDEAVDEQYSLGADFGGTSFQFFHTLVSRQRTDDHSLFLSSSFFFFFFFAIFPLFLFPSFPLSYEQSRSSLKRSTSKRMRT